MFLIVVNNHMSAKAGKSARVTCLNSTGSLRLRGESYSQGAAQVTLRIAAKRYPVAMDKAGNGATT